MPQRPLPKREARALRRSLALTTPQIANPQLQSPLFAVLPSEVRNLIFEYAICQIIDPHKSGPETQSSRSRPKHERIPVMDTTLLCTCRLVYTETRTIPLQSATHHVYGDQESSYNSADWDHYLFHISSQSGQHLHHLHTISWWLPDFRRYLQPHLHWRKITWTILCSNWDFENEWETGFSYADKISTNLNEIRFPNTCREVTLELEVLRKNPKYRRKLRAISDQFREIQLTRRDESKIALDENYCMEYTWDGETWQPGDWEHGPGGYVSATYHTIRLCWRAREPEREYMHYDHWDCLRSNKIKEMPSGYSSEKEENA
ncbi:hypothetical protein P171DRAFT_430966 [Karstenula rhodostoma CBS 690.94]|uniref:F-box domain-containing protein n=1 Tax=Karstenula rhodostoma CBS 690.94 TaxID=1392251 RepID=A0A9P4UCT3_9PLEO|nr:hypothetical protein P171DRAFT_430966 [Karstenula rhodostoma CBS 690.94]